MKYYLIYNRKAVVMNSKYDFIKDAVEHISDPEDA